MKLPKPHFRWFISTVREAERIPYLHGIISHRMWQGSSISVLIPFNIVARLGLTFWEFLKVPKYLWWERGGPICTECFKKL